MQQPSRANNFLDLIFSNGQNVSADVREGVFPSDHYELVCNFRTVLGPLPVVSRSSALNYKRADWEGLRTTLRLVPWTMLDELPVDEATDRFYDILDAAIHDHIPVVQLRRKQPPWFDAELRRALRDKESAHRTVKRTGRRRTRRLLVISVGFLSALSV